MYINIYIYIYMGIHQYIYEKQTMHIHYIGIKHAFISQQQERSLRADLQTYQTCQVNVATLVNFYLGSDH